jgi:hypothetical protein
MTPLFRIVALSFFLSITLIAEASGGHSLPSDKSSSSLPYPLNVLIPSLYEMKTFRKQLADIEAVLKPYCITKTTTNVTRESIRRYECAGEKFVAIVELSYSASDSGQPIVMFLDITFPSRLYHVVTADLVKRLGKPRNRWSDTTRWVYSKDKELNKLGTPVVLVKPDPETSTAFITLSLEQGP